MKKTFKIASVILALAMIFSMTCISVSAATAATTYTSSESQSSMKNVSLDNGTVTGTFNLWGYPTSLKVYVGQQNGASPSGTTVYEQSWTAGQIGIATDTSISAALSDGGVATTGYTVVASASNGNWAAAYIPYAGPLYQMEIQRNGSKVSSVDLGLNEGVASGFKFVYESGHSYTYAISDSSVISIALTGDNFTITPLKVGTATITAKCDGTNEQTLTVNVTDDSSLSAVWYATQASITNGATFEANCGKAYGFGVEAFPDNVTVALTANTAGATITESSVEGQFPYAIKGTTPGGAATVNITGQTKTITFTVNFTDAAFDFFMDANFDEVAEPLVAVPVNTNVTVYANKPVATWEVNGTSCTTTNTTTSITLKGVTVGEFTTITAKDANGNVLQWFDAYVTGESTEEPANRMYTIAKIDSKEVYNNFYGAYSLDQAALIINNKAYVPMRNAANLLYADIQDYDDATNSFYAVFSQFKVKMQIDSQNIEFYTTDGTFVYADTIPADQVPVLVNGKAYLPARQLATIASMDSDRQVEYVSNSDGEYVAFIMGERATLAEVEAMIAVAKGYIG